MSLPKHSRALDGLRGIAITLVIASHAFPSVPALPWTIKRFSNLGFFGVQLFFVVSAFTLANSWRRAEAAGTPSLTGFALRRVFRIAPAYFLAAAGYALLHHAPSLPPERLLTFLTFTSGWSPAQMPTLPGAYVIVPGGWSIAAEFAFYALFPLLMAVLRGPRACLAALAFSLPLAWAANGLGHAVFAPLYGEAATDQFLYYWLPDQLPVFLTGILAFEIVRQEWRAPCSPLVAPVACAVFASLGVLAWPRLPDPSHGFIPAQMIAACAFAAVTVAWVRAPSWVVTNRFLVCLGQASFSAYLLHFAVLDALRAMLPATVLQSRDVTAAVAGTAIFAGALGLTVLLAQATYRCVEMPFIRLGGQLSSAAICRPPVSEPKSADGLDMSVPCDG